MQPDEQTAYTGWALVVAESYVGTLAKTERRRRFAK